MWCTDCGCENQDSANYCRKCGSFINTETTTYQKDKNSIGMNILSFLFPIVGVICFFIWRKESPKKAQGVLISGIVSFCISFSILM